MGDLHRSWKQKRHYCWHVAMSLNGELRRQILRTLRYLSKGLALHPSCTQWSHVDVDHMSMYCAILCAGGECGECTDAADHAGDKGAARNGDRGEGTAAQTEPGCGRNAPGRPVREAGGESAASHPQPCLRHSSHRTHTAPGRMESLTFRFCLHAPDSPKTKANSMPYRRCSQLFSFLSSLFWRGAVCWKLHAGAPVKHFTLRSPVRFVCSMTLSSWTASWTTSASTMPAG